MDTEPAKKWKVQHLWPEKSKKEVSELLAAHFNKILSEFTPLRAENIPSTFSKPIRDLTLEEVSTKLKKLKKPHSTVPGDIPPSLVTKFYRQIAIPLTSIFNGIKNEHVWPSSW